MSLVENLLLLYVGVLAFSAVLSAALWLRSRTALHRDLFYVWAASIVAFGAQGALAHGTLPIVLGFSCSFAVNLALANLTSSLFHSKATLRVLPFVGVWLAALLLATLLNRAQLPFVWVALPVSVAVALPLLVVNTRAILARWSGVSVNGKALLVSSYLFCLHNLDFAFLRDRPSAAPLGFTIAILIIFALSVSAPARVLELVSQSEARVSVELAAARRIQTGLLPHDRALAELEFVSHMRPASSVGGDFFDIHQAGDRLWFFLGDVTGHGLGAGLVTLMAQSTIQSILASQQTISPRELNWIANRVLCENLGRLGEQRHMTIVSICRVSQNHFLISGSHDDVYVYRAASGQVEVVPLQHFPLGLGFLPGLLPQDVHESQLTLEQGDVLFVGTDGITEAARGGDESKELFGESRVLAFLAEHGARPLLELKSELIAALERFTAGVYHDDVAFMMLRAREGQ